MRMLMRMALTALLALLAADQALSEQIILSDINDEYPRLNFSSPSPLIFHSLFGLLQQWPNTFFEFGHTITTCTIPKHTNLYHARPNADPISSPEWFAFDPEMSYGIFGGSPDCHMHTYRTVRDVKCLYFDGASASLTKVGDTESQMAFIYNSSANIPDPSPFRPRPGYGAPYNHSRSLAPEIELVRAKGLCDFIHERNLSGPGWGYEGVVRMNSGFELIWCNFSSPSARLVSKLNISAPRLEGESPFPYAKLGFSIRGMFSWLSAAGKRFGFAGGVPQRGETRVKLDSCGIFSFYDPGMHHQERVRVQSEKKEFNLTSEGFWNAPTNRAERFPALEKLGRRRRGQRAMNVSTSDGLYMRHAVESRMRANLQAHKHESCVGIDWISVARDIVSAHSDELNRLREDLSKFNFVTNDTEIWKQLSFARGTAHHIYIPYYEYPTFEEETLDDDFSMSAPSSQAALQRCSSQYEVEDMNELSDHEVLMYSVISDVLAAICGTVLPVFLSIERLWFGHLDDGTEQTTSYSSLVQQQNLLPTIRRNGESIEELMAWLGWVDQWTACSPACGTGQTCYIPMFPILMLSDSGNRTQYPPSDIFDDWEKQLWQPRCLDPQTYSDWVFGRLRNESLVLGFNDLSIPY